MDVARLACPVWLESNTALRRCVALWGRVFPHLGKKTMNFNDFGLMEDVSRALTDLGFETPTPIQEKAIPTLLQGTNDFVGLAQTGTGKTCAYGVPLIHHMDKTRRQTQGVIVCPTRELCLQITNDLLTYTKYIPGLRVVAVYGGASMGLQIRQIERGVQIVVATPGRLLDLIRRGVLDLTQAGYVVLDEADEMLNMGFQEDIDAIFENLSEDVRVWLFSATMPSGVRAIAQNYLHDAVEVRMGERNVTAENISHHVYMVIDANKYEGLRRILDFTTEIFGLVFCRTRVDTQELAERLVRDGYPADSLHGDLSQAQRDSVMRKFRQKNIKILVATDVAARGLDVEGITHVVHFDLPDDPMAYTHRSGRTARAGKSGLSIALVNPRDRYRVKDIERRCGLRFEFKNIPDGPAICRRRLLSYADAILGMEGVTPESELKDVASALPKIMEMLDSLDKEELIRRVIVKEFHTFLESYRDARDINVQIPAPPKRDYRSTEPTVRKRGAPFVPPERGKNYMDRKQRPTRFPLNAPHRFFISVGRIDKLHEGAIVRLICDQADIPSRMIGDIEMKREFSFFDVDQRVADKVRRALKDAVLDGKPVKIREAFEDKGDDRLKRKKRLRETPWYEWRKPGFCPVFVFKTMRPCLFFP